MRTPVYRCIITLGVLLAALAFASSASAETTGPVWKIMSVSNPTNFKPEDKTGADAIVVTATNVGGSAAGCTQAQIELEKKGRSRKRTIRKRRTRKRTG